MFNFFCVSESVGRNLPSPALLMGSLAVPHTETDTMSFFIILPIFLLVFTPCSVFVPSICLCISEVCAFCLYLFSRSLFLLSHSVILALSFSPCQSLCQTVAVGGLSVGKANWLCKLPTTHTSIIYAYEVPGGLFVMLSHTHIHAHTYICTRVSIGAHTRTRTDTEIHL